MPTAFPSPKKRAQATGAGSGAAGAEELIWLDYDAAEGKATLVTPEGYDSALDAMILTGYRPRQKDVLAFDTFDLLNSDNKVYGIQGTAVNSDGSARHFNQRIAEMIAELRDEYPEEYGEYYQAYYAFLKSFRKKWNCRDSCMLRIKLSCFLLIIAPPDVVFIYTRGRLVFDPVFLVPFILSFRCL